MNTLQDDMDYLINRMKEVHAENQDMAEPERNEKGQLGKKIKLANLVLDDAIAEGCFEGFESGTNRQIEMARVLNERLKDYDDTSRNQIPEPNQPVEDLLDIVTSYLEKCNDEERLLGEDLWEAAEKALENDKDPIAAMDLVLGIEPAQDEATEEWQELLGDDGDEETPVVSDLTELEAEVVADVLEKLTPVPEPEPEMPEPETEPETEPEPEMPEFDPMDFIQPATEEPQPEPETPEPEPKVEPVNDERLDAISEIEVRWSNQADAEKLLEPLERQTELVDTDGLTIQPTPKRYSGPVPVIHSEPQNMTSIFVKEKQVERQIEQIVELYEETLADLNEYRQRLTALRDSVRRRL